MKYFCSVRISLFDFHSYLLHSIAMNESRALLSVIRRSAKSIDLKSNKNEDDESTQIKTSLADVTLAKLEDLMEKDDLSILKTHLTNGSVQLNSPIGSGRFTLTHLAAAYASSGILSYLIQQQGLKVNQEDANGNTPLMTAVLMSPSDPAAYHSALLITQHDQVVIAKTNKNSSSPLVQAVRRGFKNTTSLLFLKQHQSAYSPQDIAMAIKTAAIGGHDDIGQQLLDSVNESMLGQVLNLLALPPPLHRNPLANSMRMLLITETSDHTCLDAGENKLFVGCIVQTLSKELMRRHFPPTVKDRDVAILADQKAIVHSISGDRLYLEFTESNNMAVVKAASVFLVQPGTSVRVADGSTVTVGRFVRVTEDKAELEELQGTERYRHGMERMCGRTGRLVRIGKDGLIQVQFSTGGRFYYDPRALFSSTEEELEGCDGSGTWYRKGSPVKITVTSSIFAQLQQEISFPFDDTYKQLVGKLVQVDKVSIKSFSMQKILRVLWNGQRYNINGQAVTAVNETVDHSGQTVRVGDNVKVIDDKKALQGLQTDTFGGWVADMAEEDEGTVKEFVMNPHADTLNPLVNVKFPQRSFYFNPKCLRISKQEKPNDTKIQKETPGTSAKLALIKRSQLRCTDKLGEGGFGAVYKGTWDLGNGKVKIVAIKRMNYGVTSSNTYEDVIKEAKIQAALNHPNIVNLFGMSYGPQEDLWLVMKLVPGLDLQTILFPSSGRRSFDLPFKFKVKISLDMAYAIAFIHSQGFVHQDIKPSNMMVDQRTGTLYLCDFGITRYLGNMDITTFATKFTQNFGGTLLYVAPECLRQNDEGCHVRPTFKSDVWSLGATFYEIFAERHLFDDGMRCFQCKLQNDSESVQKLVMAHVPKEVKTIVRKTLDFVPQRRPNAHQLTDFFHAIA